MTGTGLGGLMDMHLNATANLKKGFSWTRQVVCLEPTIWATLNER